MKGRALITGGAGFLGSHLCDRLLRAGYQVRLLDCLDPQVHAQGAPTYLSREAELRVGNVLRASDVEAALEGVDVVVHFAAVVGVGQSLYQIARYNEVNLQGTAVLLEALLHRQHRLGRGLVRLLLAGSMSVYGEGRYWCGACRRQREAGGRPLGQLRRKRWEMVCPICGAELEPRPTDEAKAPQLASFYALTKYMQEEMCRLFGRTYEVPTVVLRFFNAYGPRQALSNPYTGVAAVFANELMSGRRPQVFEDGGQLRDLVSVHDVAAACQLALETDAAANGIFNIASGESLTVAELACRLAWALGSNLQPAISGRFRRGDARHCVADITAARQRLGFTPQVPLADGLRELAAWLASQRRRPLATQARANEELLAFGLTG